MRIAQRLRAAAMLVGMEFARRCANVITVASSRSTKSEHGGRNRGSAAAVRKGLRAKADFGQEQAQPLRIAGDEGQRLNRNDFSDFPGVVNRLFHLVRLPFRNLWSLF